MFIMELDKERQKAFLNLAYTMIYADNVLAKEEKRIFHAYAAEVDIDFLEAHKVDFEKELAIFDSCSTEEKLSVFFELYAIALSDKVYAEEEKALISIAQKRFGITDEKVKEMHDGLQKAEALRDELRGIVYESK